MVRSMMSQTTLPKSFWDYAIESAACILNMVSTKKVEKTPYEVWHGQAPKLSYLKVRGCEALVKHDTLTKPDKLEPRSIKCIFIGYPKETMGYFFYYPPENKIFVARNAEFLENSLINHEASGSLEDLEIIQEEDTHPSLDTSLNHEEDDQEIDEPQSDINPIPRSTRTRRPTNRLYLYVDTEEHELGDLVDLSPNGKTVGHKWLFKKKTDIDGAVHTYKARLVAKGFTQTSGIDYEETFSPVTDIRAIRILIAIAAFYDYEIWKMDVKTAFLNGYLNEEVYMEQPEGDDHWTAVKNILKYLRNTKDMFLTGYVFVLNGGVVDWKSTKQSIFATSTTDAEFIAAFNASKEAVWIQKFIYGLGVVSTIEEPINMYCDNTRAIAITKDHGITKGARHFSAKVYYLRETIEMGDVRIEKVDTDDNLADPFTKALEFPKHYELTKKIGMIPASSLIIKEEIAKEQRKREDMEGWYNKGGTKGHDDRNRKASLWKKKEGNEVRNEENKGNDQMKNGKNQDKEGGVKSANKYAILEDFEDENADMVKLKGRMIVDVFLRKKLQPNVIETKDWTHDMVNYFKDQWEIDRQKEIEEMNGDIEDVLDGTTDIAKELSTKEIEGIKRRCLWDDLRMKKNITNGRPWILLGDFNVTLKADKHFAGGSKITRDMKEFDDCVNDIELLM
ncbi:retrotransposon protein, putative, ty1-copia subclass [Tanacetum coccineum]